MEYGIALFEKHRKVIQVVGFRDWIDVQNEFVSGSYDVAPWAGKPRAFDDTQVEGFHQLK